MEKKITKVRRNVKEMENRESSLRANQGGGKIFGFPTSF